MARHRFSRRREPTTQYIDYQELNTEQEIPGHKRRPKRRRILVGVLGVALLAGLAIAVVTKGQRSEPATQIGFEDGTSPGWARPETTQTTAPPATATYVLTSPSAPAIPSARPSRTRKTPVKKKERPAASKTKAAAAPSADERKIEAFITGYSYFDNTPPGSATISNPVLHETAGGTGTYSDPITVAVGHSMSDGDDILDWPKGTRFYIPNVRRYFIVEDTCGDGSSPQDGPCHTGYEAPAITWLDIWIGGKGGSSSGSDACMDSITDNWAVLVNPSPNYVTVPGSVYGANGCTKQYGNTAVPAS